LFTDLHENQGMLNISYHKRTTPLHFFKLIQQNGIHYQVLINTSIVEVGGWRLMSYVRSHCQLSDSKYASHVKTKMKVKYLLSNCHEFA